MIFGICGVLGQSEGFTPNGDIFFLGALGIGVGSGIGGSSAVAAAVRGGARFEQI